MKFSNKLIAFVDILGFKKLVEAAETGKDNHLDMALSVFERYGSPQHRNHFRQHGPINCPPIPFIERDLDFRATAISDCLVISSEVSPAGAINLLQHCWAFALDLLTNGLMCRGFVTRGQIYHSDTRFVGTGYQKALAREHSVIAFKRKADEMGTPFIEIDRDVCEYIESQNDARVKQMFGRIVKGDGNVMAIFPFQCLEHSFIIGDYREQMFDTEREKESNQKLRAMLINMKMRVMELIDHSNSHAVQKGEHYLLALDKQLAVCDSTDELLGRLSSSFPRQY